MPWLTKGLPWLHQPQPNLRRQRQLLQELGDLKVSTADHASPVDRLYQVPHPHLGGARCNAPRLDSLYECVARSVVRDGEAEGWRVFQHSDVFGAALDVSEDEVLEPDLAPKEMSHVDLVRVQSAEEDLIRSVGQGRDEKEGGERDESRNVLPTPMTSFPGSVHNLIPRLSMIMMPSPMTFDITLVMIIAGHLSVPLGKRILSCQNTERSGKNIDVC